MKSKVYFIVSMIIFGTIGVFVRYIPLASSEIALLRGLIGSFFLVIILMAQKKRISFMKVKKNILILLFSGIALGCNWMFLFEAYKYTTIANATLSYYFAPIIVMILSLFILKEKFVLKKAICIGVALFGMLLIMQSGNQGSDNGNHFIGIGYGLAAASCYAALTLANKFIKQMNEIDTTVVQLIFSALILFPYVLLKEEFGFFDIKGMVIILVIIVGIIHTGVGFYLFFTGVKRLKAQSIDILSYIDPVVSLIVSFIILGESMTTIQIIGAVFLLGSTMVSELR